MKRIVHLIPYHEIGGVEIAARSLPTGCHGELEFERNYLVKAPTSTVEAGEYHGPEVSLNNPRAFWGALLRLYRDPPNLLVASLWRSALVLICLKILRPRTRTVIFLHLAHDVHLVDKLANRAAMSLSDAIWADSSVTLDRRVPRGLHGKGRVVSFLLNQRSLPEQCDPVPEFIFWGRLNAQKGLDRALGLFATLVRQRRDARFTIIGPDGGMEDQLRARVAELGLRDHVVFKGRMRHADIADAASRASFYLQTSRDEGMAMSVVEAMQNGLVPVVTPVGEISNYCDDKDSAIFVHEDDAAVEAVLALLADPDQYRRMSCAAAKYWQEKPLYRDDFLDAARELIGSRGDEA
ncbi:glycosyltransferase family 4 protein [Pseudogemmobacter sp. W21_MBD1_M6]|uniref:glycosyltransferase family 4 protein n=1 Tax=Pseudogemmobacter sp. W21_MBD1_M6 TaxID=3240271 RepID=UPI003F9889AE